MADSSKKSSLEELRHWIVEHKLRAVGCLWLSSVAGSLAYNWSRPNMKTSVKLIHARLHAQGLTLASLAIGGAIEYYDAKSGAKSERYAKFLPPPPPQTHNHKD
ncbi:hypothetical protein ACHQM5_026640 [Ranunculus cassubicifolius]